MSEAWAGVLIGLSLCMYLWKRPKWAVPLGLLALFVRELAAPYCVLCTGSGCLEPSLARSERVAERRVLYALYYGWHLMHVWAQRQPNDLAFKSSWFELGGLPSLLVKAQWQGWLLLSPPWVTALALTVVVGGIYSAQTPAHVRLAGASYVGFFLVAGRPFDGYWGLIAWPSWALACAFGIDLIRQAINAIFFRLPRP